MRCPGHTIHFLRFDYAFFVRQVLELAGVNFKELLKEVKEYESWTPYQLQRAKKG